MMMKTSIPFSLLALFFVMSCDDIIEVEDISNKTVTILAPTNNSMLTIDDVSFTWQTVEDAERYTIQIATPDFENAIQVVLDSTTTTTNISKTLSSGNYQWRVKAKNSDYETPYTTQNLSIE